MDVFFPAQVFLQGSITAPASKSVMQRVLAIAFLGRGILEIENPSYCLDALFLLRFLVEAGVEILEKNDQKLVLNNQGVHQQYMVNCGESALALRMLSVILSLNADENKPCTLYGEASLLRRNMKDLTNFLQEIDIKAETQDDFLPIQIKGKLKAQHKTLKNVESSQYLTGLLMALPLLTEDSHLEIKTIKSKPYIDLTLEILTHFKVLIQEVTSGVYQIRGQQTYEFSPIVLEGDWSGAAFWCVAGILNGQIDIAGLRPNSQQADIKILTLFKDLQLPYSWDHQVLKLKKANFIPSFTFDLSDCPDLFPALVVLASFAEGFSHLRGIHRLKNKESDRLQAAIHHLKMLKIPHQVKEDELIVEGVREIEGASLPSFGDHRMAMMASIFALKSKNGIIVEDFYAIEKSYPAFMHDYFRLTAHLG